jgi:hypothetical protein
MFRTTHRSSSGAQKLVFDCQPLRWLSQPKTYVKPEAAITVFER